MTQQDKDKLFSAYKWNTSVNTFNRSQDIGVERGSNGYTATNRGDTIVFVNNQILFPSATPLTVAGDSVSNIGNLGELYTAEIIRVVFQAPVGLTPLVEIQQKFYTELQ